MNPQTPQKSSKGRPPLEPRIAELERKVEALLRMIETLKAPMPSQSYEPRFERWGN